MTRERKVDAATYELQRIVGVLERQHVYDDVVLELSLAVVEQATDELLVSIFHKRQIFEGECQEGDARRLCLRPQLP